MTLHQGSSQELLEAVTIAGDIMPNTDYQFDKKEFFCCLRSLDVLFILLECQFLLVIGSAYSDEQYIFGQWHYQSNTTSTFTWSMEARGLVSTLRIISPTIMSLSDTLNPDRAYSLDRAVIPLSLTYPNLYLLPYFWCHIDAQYGYSNCTDARYRCVAAPEMELSSRCTHRARRGNGALPKFLYNWGYN